MYILRVISMITWILALASSSVVASGGIELHRVHAYSELSGDMGTHGCDLWNPVSLSCRWASHQYCSRNGFAGGTGPLELDHGSALIACAKKTVAQYKEFAYGESCSFESIDSRECRLHALAQCENIGFAASLGIIGANPKVVATVCVKNDSQLPKLSGVNVSNLRLPAESQVRASCDKSDLVAGKHCMPFLQEQCKARLGTSAFGLSVISFNSGSNETQILCGMADKTVAKIASSPIAHGYVRPLEYDENLLGGPAFFNDGPLTFADGLVNNFNSPVLVTLLKTNTNYYSESMYGPSYEVKQEIELRQK